MIAAIAPENYVVDDSAFDLNAEFVTKLSIVQTIYGGTACKIDLFTVTILQPHGSGRPLKYLNVYRRGFYKHLEEVCRKQP